MSSNRLINDTSPAQHTNFTVRESSHRRLRRFYYNALSINTGNMLGCNWQPDNRDAEMAGSWTFAQYVGPSNYWTVQHDSHQRLCLFFRVLWCEQKYYHLRDKNITKNFLLQIFFGHYPFHNTKNKYQVMVAVKQHDIRPPCPSDDRCYTRGLTNEIWDLMNEC